MGDFRISYGRALGRVNNFFVRTDGLAANADTTPDVTDIGLLYTANTNNTAITYFDVRTPMGNNTQPGWFEGKELRVIFLDDSTSLTRSNQMIIYGDQTTYPQNTIRDFIFHNSAWIETHQPVSLQSRIVTVESKNLTGSVLSLGTGGVSVLGKSVIRLVAEAGSNCILRTALNGYPGQVITLIATGASDALVICNSATNIDGTFADTTSAGTQFRLASSAAISFIKQGNRWLEIRPISGNSSGQLQ